LDIFAPAESIDFGAEDNINLITGLQTTPTCRSIPGYATHGVAIAL
jgi:hypothetical protein